MAPSSIPWGTITLHLDNETFRKAFIQERRMYFDDSEYDLPPVASRMSPLDAAGSVLDEDGKGGYRFDRVAFESPLDTLGFVLGSMNGPILADSPQEREERMQHIVVLPEIASPPRIAV